jgi:hypothetical protein
VTSADQHPGLLQAGQELLFRARSGSGGTYLPAQGRPGRFVPSAPGRLLRLGAGSAWRRCDPPEQTLPIADAGWGAGVRGRPLYTQEGNLVTHR